MAHAAVPRKVPRPALHAAVAVGDKVYSFGGSFHDGITGRMEVHVFNTVSLLWEKLPLVTTGAGECPSTRYRHTAVLMDNVIYVWGGFTYTGDFSNVLYAFDVDTHRWFKPDVHGDVPEARYNHAACVSGKVMYVFGGENMPSGCTNDIYKLDATTMVWSSVKTKGTSSSPPASARHSATIIGTKMFVFGGVGHRGVHHDSIGVFDTETDRWLSSAAPPQWPGGRENHSAFAYGGELYIVGGNDFERSFDDVWTFDPETFSWRKGERLSLSSGVCCSCMVGARIFLFGGYTSDDLYVVDLLRSLKTTLRKQVFGAVRSVWDSKRQLVTKRTL